MFDTKTKLFGIIGKPVHHSKSPVLHNALFNKYKVNSVYLAFETDDTKKAVKAMRTLNIKGLSVTIPNKISVMNYIDKLDESARLVGAVNTLINENGIITGYNTDVFGVSKSFESNNVHTNMKDVLILGSGGAARSVISALLLNTPKKISILAIDKEQISNLVEFIKKNSDLSVEGFIIDEVELEPFFNNADIIINSSPVGMYPDTDLSPCPKEFINSMHTVFDVIYNPIKTKLLNDALSNNAKIIKGIDMFIYQAYKQFNLFSGINPDYDFIKDIVS